MNFLELTGLWTGHRQRMVQLDLLAASTFANHAAITGCLLTAFSEMDIAEIRKSDIELYVGKRLKTCKPITVNGELNVLRQILNWAVDEGHLAARPRFPTVKVPNTEPPLPDDEAFVWFLKNLPQHHADALEFMLLTGLAPHELERIRKSDIEPTGDMRDGAATCAIYIGYRVDFAIKQPSRKRVIPLNKVATNIWERNALMNVTGRSMFPPSGTIEKAMRRLVQSHPNAPESADGLTPKMMRKWFASKIATECSEAVLQRLLGHAPGSKITRKHYVRTTDRQLGEAVGGIIITGNPIG